MDITISGNHLTEFKSIDPKSMDDGGPGAHDVTFYKGAGAPTAPSCESTASVP